MILNPQSAVLKEIFGIKHIEKGESFTKECIDLFCKYLTESELQFISLSGSDVLRSVTSILKNENDNFGLVWLGKYDSVILASKNTKSSMSSIELITLDGWTSQIMSDVRCGRETAATSGHSNTFCLGQVPSDENFITNFRKSFEKLSSCNDISSLLHTIQSKLSTMCNLTNMPIVTHKLCSHSGENKRGASWSLVKAIINAITDQHLPPLQPTFREECLFKRMEVDFYVWVLERIDVGSKVTTHLIDTFMSAHRTASIECAALADNDIAERLRVLRSKLETATIKSDLRTDLRLLNDTNTTAWCKPVIKLPPECNQSPISIQCTSDLLREVKSNLGALAPFPSDAVSPKDISAWLASTSNSAAPKRGSLQLVMRSLEHWFFNIVHNLQRSSDESRPAPSFISEIESLLFQYRAICASFRGLSTKSNLMKVELNSIEVLCVWIAKCMVHSAASKEHPLLLQYDVALKWTDLHHLVFSEKAAADAALAVAAYLKRYTSHSQNTDTVIFSLSNQEGTFKMAREYSLSDVGIVQVWEKELEAAEIKRQTNFQAAVQKQQKAAKLRREIAKDKEYLAELMSKKAQLRSLHSGSHKYWALKRELDPVNIKITSTEEEITSKQSLLSKTMKSLPMVYQALPEDKNAAMTALFFFYMPNSLRTLARLTIVAQQMLLPRSSSPYSISGNSFKKALDKSMAVDVSKKMSLWGYFCENGLRRYIAEPNNLLLRYQGVISKKLPYDIDSYQKPSDGTWHPDTLECRMSWTGGDYTPDQLITGDFNPFKGDSHSLVGEAQRDFFTEQLSVRASSLFWTMKFSDSSVLETTRGNRGIAELDTKPDWLNKPQFLAFCTVRSYPNTQLRKLYVALRDGSLPLNCPEVLILLKQALYHIGVIEVGANEPQELALSWKRDGVEVYDKIKEELCRLLELLRESPKDHPAMHLLGEVAVFVTQQLPSCRNLARKISDISLKWATDIDEEIDALARGNCTDPEIIYEQRAMQFLFYSYSLLCHRIGELTAEDAASIVKLIVLARNMRVFGDRTTIDAEVAAFEISLERAMTGLAARLHVALTAQAFSPIFTSAVGVVIDTSLISQPDALQWGSVSDALCCFEATDWSTGSPRLLSLNAVSGVVLCDGLPPRRLPSSVTGDSMYFRSFGTRDFEVTVSAGVFTTSRPLMGCIYEFTPPRGGAGLIIIERHIDSGVVLQLLAGDKPCGWNTELPRRLQEMCTHWYSKAHDTIILRAIPFLKRNISFLITGDFADTGVCTCFSIPHNYQSQSILTLLDTIANLPQHFDRLVLFNPHLVKVIMKKFENPAFVHTFITDEESFIISLPRFGLKFKTSADGAVHSLEHKGYRLADTQQLEGTLRSFNEYLVLRNDAGDVRVIISTDIVMIDPKIDEVTTASNQSCDTVRKNYCYNIDPRLKTLKGSNIAAQLHLAALYAATATALPEPLTGRTGDEMAIQIVRECFVNRPLTTEEHRHLQNTSQYCNRDPSLILLCHDLFEASTLLSALYPESLMLPPIPFDKCAATQYVQSHLADNYHRINLTPFEEERLFNKTISIQNKQRKIAHRVSEYCRSSEDENIVTQYEAKLHSLVDEQQIGHSSPIFPLQSRDSSIDKAVRDDLKSSYTAYHALSAKILLPNKRCNILPNSERISAIVSLKRTRIEKHLLKAINTISDIGLDAAGFEILKWTNAVPSVTLEDLMRIALTPEIVLAFNPFFTATACVGIRADVLLWLQLCVLEDKLHRIVRLAGQAGGDELLIQELLTKRDWSIERHPYWLVYEVVNALQIRPTQYDVALSLIQNEGAIVQLNMGEGKTRVILPMLILYWASVSKGRNVMRLHFLTQLLNEGYAHLHSQLSRSVLQCKLFLMPFNRDVELGVATVRRMHQHVLLCKESGGCIIMAREHRQSLQLKTLELTLLNTEASQATLAELSLLSDRTYLDMLDESDELLHYRTELVYAVGDAQILPGGTSRWAAAEAVLLAINFDPAVKALFDTPNLCVYDTADHDDTSETFHKIRLLEGEVLDAAVQLLRQAIAQHVLQNPPHKMRWIAKLREEERETILTFITNPTTDEKSAQSGVWKKENAEDLLALRGLLSYGILFHCLQKRHRVNYGIKRINGKKRSVVPFRASDVPSERSEFAHPDISIVLTMLSYYSDGLTQDQLKEALNFLFDQGDIEQRAVYNEWLTLSRGSMSAEDISRIDEVSKIDYTNPCLFSLLYKHFRHNMCVVNCWLKWIVFPIECMQYPQKLSASAWNLVDNPAIACRGFSGTDDRKLLLPLQVHSQVVYEGGAAGVLSATNGKMLHLLMEHAKYEHLDLDISAGAENLFKKSWQAVIERSQKRGCIALFDAGARMAGVDNLEVAKYVLRTMSLRPKSDTAPLKAVLFFNTKAGVDGWQIRDSEGREWLRYSSPILEIECFVIFDESRCIGTDVKMPQFALCMLTIGTNMCKDKLMQAAGRARMLGRGQTLLLLGLSDVTNKIHSTSSLQPQDEVQPLHVLEWVVGNTITAVREGLLMWADQGVHFCISQGATGAQFALQEYKLLLEDMYSRILGAQVPAHAQKESAGAQLRHRQGQVLSDEMQKIYDDVGGRCQELGSDYEVTLTNTDGECERELENEVIEEKLVERQFSRNTATAEEDWVFGIVARGTMADTLKAAKAVTLTGIIETYINPAHHLGDIPWSYAAVYCSDNFVKTITGSAGRYLQQHLRPVDVFLYFPDEKSALLLSEREANSILECLWIEGQTLVNVRFTHLACCKGIQDYLSPSAHTPPSRPSPLGCANFDAVNVDPRVTASLLLFNGETTYEPEAKTALTELLSSQLAKDAALCMPGLRGLSFMLSRSDLEDVCT